MDIIKLLSLIGSIGILLFVIEMIRRERLKERYALLWLGAGVVLIIMSSSREILHLLANLLDIFYPPSFLFLTAFVFLLLINLHFSLAISALTEKNKLLAQDVAMLSMIINELKEEYNKKEIKDVNPL